MQTLGDVITWGLALAALIVVPYKLAKVWLWPVVKQFFVRSPDVMSRSEKLSLQKTDAGLILVPVPGTSIEDGTDWQMPRISAYLTDNEFTIFLARQKLRDGKYRLSANKIHDAVGGNRNDVLEIVRQVRAVPDFSNRTSEQEQKREELGLA